MRIERVSASRHNYWAAMKKANDNEKKSMIYKNLIKANEVAGALQNEKEMRLYHFTEMIKCLNKALFFGQGCQDEAWVDNLVQRGPIMMPVLKEILAGETGAFKCDNFERLFTSLNPACTSLRLRLAWALQKSLFQQGVSAYDKKDHKLAWKLNKKAQQFL